MSTARSNKLKLTLKMLSAFILLCLLLMGLILSPLATPLLAWAANKFVPNLTVTDISGSIYSGLELTQLQYDSPVQVDIAKATIKLDWQCSHFSYICLHKLSVSQVNLTLPNVVEEQEEQTEPNKTFIESPIPISIEDVSVSALHIRNHAMQLKIEGFKTSTQFAKTLQLNNTEIQGLVFESLLPPTESKPFTGLTYSAPELPEIWIPLHLQVNQLNAKDLSYKRSESSQTIEQVAVNILELEGDKITWNELAVSHQKGELDSSGTTRLSHVYPTTLSLNAKLQLDHGHQQLMTLNTKGSLYELNFDAVLSGLVNGQARLKLNVLYDTFPIDGEISWSEQDINYQNIKRLYAGKVSVTGDMQAYQLLVDSRVNVHPVDDISFIADVSLAGATLTVKQLDAALLEGDIVTSGELEFVNGISASGKTQVKNINTTALLPALKNSGVANAAWDYVVTQTPQGLILLITGLEAQAQIEQNNLDVAGQVAYYQAQDLAVANLSAYQQDSSNSMELLAQIINKQKLSVQSKIKINELAQVFSHATGTIESSININGDWQDPVFDIDLSAQNIVFDPAFSNFLHAQQQLDSELNISGKLSEHRLSLQSALKDYRLQLSTTGGLQNKQYLGQLQGAEINALQTTWNVSKIVNFNYNIAEKRAALDDHCWQLLNSQGKACVGNTQFADNTARWQLEASKLPIGVWFTQAVPSIQQVSDSALLKLNHKGTFSGESGLASSLDVFVGDSIWTFNQQNPVPLQLNAFTFNASIDKDSIQAKSAIQSAEFGAINGDISLPSRAILDGEITADLNVDSVKLAPFSKLSPSLHQLEGLLNGNIVVSGAVKKPSVYGSIQLDQGLINIEQSPLKLSKWDQNFTFSGQQAQMQGSFQLGEGQGELDGLISWQDTPFAKLNVNAKEILIEHEQSKVNVSPHLTADIRAEQVTVSGNLDIPYARIKLKELPKTAVTTSSDVHLWGEEVSTDPLQNISFDIGVNIDAEKTKSVKVDAFGLTANLHGGLKVQNKPSLAGYGDLQILDGRYKAYGQNLLIRKGEVQFNGPMSQPFLFVEAIRPPELTEDGVIAGVRINGAASTPNVALFSEPVMDQGENLLYLINGSGNLSRGQGNDTNYGALLLGLGLSQSGNITNAIGKSIGIEDLTLRTSGQGLNSQISLSGNITKDLSVRFGLGLTQGQEVAIRYQILPRLYLEAVRQLSEAVSLIDVFYEFSLGDPLEPQQETTQE